MLAVEWADMTAPHWPTPWTADSTFILLNIIGATCACVVNLWDARAGWPDFRPLRLVVATFAAFYVAAYTVLFLGVFDRADWSRFVIGLAPPVWAFVWCGPALISRLIARKVAAGTARARSVPDPHRVA